MYVHYFSAPTSGGKTLVSEILILHRLAASSEYDRGLILFVVPFISLVEEKSSEFRARWVDLQVGIKCFHGDDPNHEISDDIDIAMCTIEKANSILNYLFDKRKANRLRMCVVDEVHLLSDDRRGFLLEVLLSKIKYVLKDQTQIVCMSATLPNIHDLSSWLDASLYISSFRPVGLACNIIIS